MNVSLDFLIEAFLMMYPSSYGMRNVLVVGSVGIGFLFECELDNVGRHRTNS